MLAAMLLIAIVFFLVVYRFYGRFMAAVYELDKDKKTPAEEINDGVDYCPAHPAVLTGHHFASIAGAGPIVGPIAAAALFGWLPAFIWCLIGAAFLGGVHDMGAVASSIRHGGKSVGEVVNRWMGGRAKKLFLCFTWLALVLVLAVFLELSAKTMAGSPAVAFSATLYIVLALVFGVLLYKCHVPLWVMTIIMVPIVLGAVWYGLSAAWVQTVFAHSVDTWRFVLAGYIFVASVLPVWLLLQPRDYLASYMLYFALIIGFIGMVFGAGRFEITLPAFKGFNPADAEYLWPSLFILVACGAISGFHSLVASGTTSKQIRKETDAKLIGYGSMLLEGVLAVMAIGTVMMAGDAVATQPVATFSEGFGKFASLVGIRPEVGVALGALAINSFLLTTLDTATRLGRYQLQELTNMKADRYTATIIGVAVALALLYIRSGEKAAWQLIWPIFGASNQLVAALALMGVGVWVAKGLKKGTLFLMVPAGFMMVTTFVGLLLLIKTNLASGNYLLVVVGVVLLVLAGVLIREAVAALRRTEPPEPVAE
ncbi:MAG: carbon starvation protein A [Candidatus Hydrogenedentes bacterium]|nr:carbon starvation protein A [Candidatus Hydrogenedentota bacterium]